MEEISSPSRATRMDPFSGLPVSGTLMDASRSIDKRRRRSPASRARRLMNLAACGVSSRRARFDAAVALYMYTHARAHTQMHAHTPVVVSRRGRLGILQCVCVCIVYEVAVFI